MTPEEIGERTAFLSSTPTLSGLPEAVLRLIAERMTERHFAPGHALMVRGDPGDCMVVLREGTVQVSMCGADGVTTVLASPGPGAVLGEMALLTSEPRSADVTAVEPVTAFVLEAADFTDLVQAHTDIAVVLTHLVAERLGVAPKDGLSDMVLGGYRIQRRLGRGATAVVYRATHVETGRLVALKMLSHALAFDKGAIVRFHRELDIVERLTHPNVARVFERFEAYATNFLAMEFCDGRNLDEILVANGALPEEVVRAVLGQLAAALSHVHGHDVIHKDLKPANVMLNRDGTVKLMDFGIARPPPSIEKAVPDGQPLFSGTPRYMAPEQFRAVTSHPKVDIYALGCLAFEMLTDQPPFDADGFVELVRMKMAGELQSIDKLRPGLSPDLRALLTQSLAITPDDRTLDLAALEAWARPVDPAYVERALLEA